MEVTKQFLEKVFSTKRMERYFALYPDDEAKVIGWMNCDLPEWVEAQERFASVCTEIRRRMDWE
jgi:hypothetical protein